MDDFRTFDKAYDGYRHSRERVIVFVTRGYVRVGIESNEIPFPWDGKISKIYATCGKAPASTAVEVDIEKCSQASIDSGSPVWESVLSEHVIVEVGEKSTNTAETGPGISNAIVKNGDHFRVNILTTDTEVKDLTILVTVKLR